jgi:hypothetical protein
MGLLRGMARTAVVAGTATAVSNRVSRRQERRWADEDAPQTQVSQVQTVDNSADIDKLKELGALRDQGVLTQEEFESQKAKILG